MVRRWCCKYMSYTLVWTSLVLRDTELRKQIAPKICSAVRSALCCCEKMNYMVEGLSGGFCTSDMVSWQFAITCPSLYHCWFVYPLPQPLKGFAIWAKNRQLLLSLKHQDIVPSKQCYSKLLLAMSIPADLSSNIWHLSCLRHLGAYPVGKVFTCFLSWIWDPTADSNNFGSGLST